jgi:hypothetical protein
VAGTIAMAMGSWFLVAGPASAEVVEKVTICHRTNSNTNPYVVNEPDVAGVIDGHAGHTGPVWDPTLKADHIKWGDIIPPFDYGDPGDPTHFPGLNWSSEGQDIYYGSETHEGPAVCSTPPPVEQQFGSLSLTKDVSGLPIVGTPIDGTVPTSFTAHVSCDDGHEVDVTFPITGGAGTPATIDQIEAGSQCTVVEQGVDTFRTQTVVSYTPQGVEVAPGIFVDANVDVPVTITNNFEGVDVLGADVTAPPTTQAVAPAAAVVAAATFTG